MTKSSVLDSSASRGSTPGSRGAKRRRELLEIAEQVLFEDGFNDATMHAIAVRSGASKETLYRHFHSKDDLLAEVVTTRITRLIVPLDATLHRGGSVAGVLRAFGAELLRMMMHPDVVALLRTVVAETPRRPFLGQMFYDIGPERARSNLTAFIAAAQERGELRIPSARLAATIFLGAIMSYSHAAGLVLVNLPPLTASEIEERVTEVVTLFLARYGTGGARG